MTVALHKPRFDSDVDNESEETFRPLIPPAEYIAQCIDYKELRQFGGFKKLVLTWDFTLSSQPGILLPQFFNMEHKSFKEHSFYYQAWVIANNCQRPRRKTRQYMSPEVFRNIIGTVLVVTVTPRFENDKPMPEVFHYSKVQRFLSLSVQNNWGTP